MAKHKPKKQKPPYFYTLCACKARVRDGKYVPCPEHKSPPSQNWKAP